MYRIDYKVLKNNLNKLKIFSDYFQFKITDLENFNRMREMMKATVDYEV